MSFQDLCERLVSESISYNIYPDLKILLELIVTKEIRDFSFTDDLANVQRKLFQLSLNKGNEELELQVLTIWGAAKSLPEFDNIRQASYVEMTWVTEILCTLSGSMHNATKKKSALTFMYYKSWICWVYEYRVDLRSAIRAELGLQLRRLAHSYNKIAKISYLLDILRNVTVGMSIPMSERVTMSTIHNILIPLHAPNEMVEWRDQVSGIEYYLMVVAA